MSKMPVKCRSITVFIQQPANITEVGPQFFRCHRGIIPSFPFRRRARSKRRCARARFAYLPNSPRFVFGVNPRARRTGHLSQPVNELLRNALRLGRIITTEFDQQKAVPRGKELQVRGSFSLQTINDASFKSLQRDRFELQNLRHMIRCFKSIFVTKSDKRPVLWAMDEPQFRFEHDRAGSFRPHQSVRHMKPSFRQQLIQVVTGDAPGNPGKSRAYLRAVLVPDCPELRVNFTAASSLICDALKFAI